VIHRLAITGPVAMLAWSGAGPAWGADATAPAPSPEAVQDYLSRPDPAPPGLPADPAPAASADRKPVAAAVAGGGAAAVLPPPRASDDVPIPTPPGS
jgi:hypothetical protein